ncbi:hypothetical protein ACJRO7_002522 [Eucalyptus globulus]|uniref:Spindle and kinetochore-associated protein 3 n=1 Tax=Eucalyptus globulus TaxID=34317 RepID=A0ABD3LZX4_EUCGL
MEETIAALGKSLGQFCNHLQSSVDALHQSLDRRPIPLDSASSTFIQCLNRRVSTASGDLHLLDCMTFGTVSNEKVQVNYLQTLISWFCFVDVDDVEEDTVDDLLSSLKLDPNSPLSNDGFEQPSSCSGRLTAAASMTKSFEEDSLFDDSISLKRLGISDVALATLASEGEGTLRMCFSNLFLLARLSLSLFLLGRSMFANGKTLEPNPCSRQPQKNQEDKMHDLEGPYQPAMLNLGASEVKGPKSVVKASKDEYESLPSYMKSLASWEDLLIAIENINSYLSKKENCSENKSFFQDEISSLALGPKARSYLLLLTRMKHLVVETVDGLISYRVL